MAMPSVCFPTTFRARTSIHTTAAAELAAREGVVPVDGEVQVVDA